MRRRQLMVVEGVGRFPIDMLRYAGCWPAREVDSHAIMARGRRQVRLNVVAGQKPNAERWESLGWEVVEVGA